LASGSWSLASGHWLLVSGSASSQQLEASSQIRSLTNSDNNSMLETGNFYFIFCYNGVNMLKGIRGFAPIGMMGTK
jgi:hypothetical protein